MAGVDVTHQVRQVRLHQLDGIELGLEFQSSSSPKAGCYCLTLNHAVLHSYGLEYANRQFSSCKLFFFE